MSSNGLRKVKAGIHQRFDKEKFGASEKSVLNKLEKYWYLTSSGKILNIGSSQYSYFLMKPTSIFTETFNLDRELLCLFSPYESFEHRTIDVFDTIFPKLPKARVENLCVVLISKDKDIEETIRKISNANSEDKIIVPFTYEEIYRSTNDQIYIDRFRKVFYTKDLFSFNSPLTKDSYFFGRDKLVHELIDKHNSKEHTGVFGLRKSGKTSVIYAIQRKLALEDRSILFIDCESPSIHHLRWNELLQELIKRFHSLKKSSVKINYENRYDEKNAANSFKEDIQKIYDSRRKNSTLFVFDEIERISPYTSSSTHWKEGFDFIYFWQTLRSVYQENPEIYTYMLVGTNPKSIEEFKFFGQDNPIFTSCTVYYLNSFHIDDVIEMVQTLGNFTGLTFEKDICAKLKDDFGGHPFLIRQVCSYIHRSCQATRPFIVDKSTYSSALKEFKPHLYEYFDMMLDILGVWYPDEYDMLVMLALEDSENFYELAQDNPFIIKHLVNFSLLNKGYKDSYSLTLESLDDYLKEKNQFKKIGCGIKRMLTIPNHN